MRNYYAELRQAEKLGKASVRDLLNVFLEEIKEDKDVFELDSLVDDLKCLTIIPGSKKLSKMYKELLDELCGWYSKNANAFKA